MLGSCEAANNLSKMREYNSRLERKEPMFRTVSLVAVALAALSTPGQAQN